MLEIHDKNILFDEKYIPPMLVCSAHPVIEGYDPPEGWAWCYVDELFFELPPELTTPQRGPIPRFV